MKIKKSSEQRVEKDHKAIMSRSFFIMHSQVNYKKGREVRSLEGRVRKEGRKTGGRGGRWDGGRQWGDEVRGGNCRKRCQGREMTEEERYVEGGTKLGRGRRKSWRGS